MTSGSGTMEEILEFWFGSALPGDAPTPERLRFWFNGGEEADRLIRDGYAAVLQRGAEGELDHWDETPRGSLALIVLLDQFPRNIHRDTPAAYACDPKALDVALRGLERGFDRPLAMMERAFFYLPLEHAEDLALQERSVALFGRLRDDAPPALKGVCDSFYDYAVRHRDIIARFGRFPHRNRVLGRESSAEEIEFLKEPGSSF